MFKRILFPILVIAALWGAYELNKGDAPFDSHGKDEANGCSDDWHMCRNASDLMKHNKKSIFYRSSCQVIANQTAEYGAPEWEKGLGIIPFSSFNPDSDFHQGSLLLFEDHALVPNRYGGKERSRIACFFDLNKDKVAQVLVVGRPVDQ